MRRAGQPERAICLRRIFLSNHPLEPSNSVIISFFVDGTPMSGPFHEKPEFDQDGEFRR